MSLISKWTWGAALAVVLGAVAANPARGAAAQEAPKRQPAPLGYGAYASPWGGSMQWLLMEQVRKELELVDDQRQKIDKIRTQLQEETATMYKRMQEAPAEERMKRYAELNAELAAKTEKQVREVLLPHQLDRLRQIRVQMQIRNYYGAGGALASDDLAQELKITEEQKARLREVQQQVQQDMAQKTREFYEKLQAEALQKILSVLTEAQRKQLEKLQGQKFEWQPYGQPGATPQKK